MQRVPAGPVLADLARAAVERGRARVRQRRDEVWQVLGPAALADVAAIIARYSANNRIADATGTRIDADASS